MSGKVKSVVPELRFPDFNEEWECFFLGDKLGFKNGFNGDREKYGHGIKFINILDIINNKFITYDKILSSVEVSESEFQKNKVSYGDILFQRSSEIREEVGQSTVYLDKSRDAIFGGFVIRGKQLQKNDPVFLNYLLKTNTVRRDIISRSGGSTRYNIGQDALSLVQITIPLINEQEKIGKFLSDIDNKIESIIKKKEYMQEYKKGLMQKIFSQELRFKNDDGNDFPDWKRLRLGEIFKQRTEKGGAGQGLLSVTLSFGVVKRTKIKGKDNSSADKSNYRKVCKGDIAYNSMRMWQGACGVSLYDGIVSPAYTVLKGNSENSSEFFGYLFKMDNIINLFRRNSQGLTSDTWNLKYPQFSTIKLYVPSLAEQNKIVNCFAGIDCKIESLDMKLEQMEKFKQGLLQKMFV